ncbi:MAG: DUF3341 domain-containing protein [Bacteroidia bacterium]
MKSNLIVAKFWHPERMMEALADVHHRGIPVYDAYTPFPIHGIEQYLDIKRTRLTIAGFIYGCCGLLAAFLLIVGVYRDWGPDWFQNVFIPWPMDIGGKPSLAWVDFVPISFELTVLFSAHGMVLTFLIVGRYYPGKKAKLLDIRQTDDVFVVAIDADKVKQHDKIKEIFREHGAFEVETTT